MTKIILSGCLGKMGTMISNCIKENPLAEIVAGIDINNKDQNNNYPYPVFDNILKCNVEADVIIDFSRPSSLNSLISFCELKSMPIVLCTTGFTDGQLSQIGELSHKVAVFKSANMSIGINVINSVLKSIASKLYDDYDIEIIEKHHNQKVDSPSGTALLLADTIKDSLNSPVNYVEGRSGISKRNHNDIGIHAIRGGNIVGDHTVIFAGTGECIEFTHKAISREVFAIGAIKAAIFLKGKGPGLYNMDDLLK
ncbi:dihydrodipicolinate reductase [Hathewaya proteolytica DSM 3090]|uniref:4-hydroxy-tetrahydrodipicolinate reductase n=1 Tax=Hathewaya proteolytica DSM 3090 TaxID=1121331 RepID=A0A1M6QR26_9CLOT|nr:4-hydroxy-tetrahydrodipicolinate reductase [Hathewaya proteolytica]SHK22568.1 dihydrodipicolinate reductase [Hathewaya proteolytica DSM 3090]